MHHQFCVQELDKTEQYDLKTEAALGKLNPVDSKTLLLFAENFKRFSLESKRKI